MFQKCNFQIKVNLVNIIGVPLFNLFFRLCIRSLSRGEKNVKRYCCGETGFTQHQSKSALLTKNRMEAKYLFAQKKRNGVATRGMCKDPFHCFWKLSLLSVRPDACDKHALSLQID